MVAEYAPYVVELLLSSCSSLYVLLLVDVHHAFSLPALPTTFHYHHHDYHHYLMVVQSNNAALMKMNVMVKVYNPYQCSCGYPSSAVDADAVVVAAVMMY